MAFYRTVMEVPTSAVSFTMRQNVTEKGENLFCAIARKVVSREMTDGNFPISWATFWGWGL